jgi:hypothetical protein
VAFISDANPHEGWRVFLKQPGAWVQYNSVDFGAETPKNVTLRAVAEKDSVVEVRLDKPDGPLLARVDVKAGSVWNEAQAELAEAATGVHDLVVTSPDEAEVAIDWVRFQ